MYIFVCIYINKASSLTTAQRRVDVAVVERL